jgi:hypothetical protein
MAQIMPDELLKALCAKSNARKQHSLGIVHNVCKEQHERGSLDFSIATIGRLSQKQGGPACQSIRNATGEDYRALIQSWAELAQGKMKKPVKSASGSSSDNWLSKISDPAVRAIVGITLAENKKLRDEINLLKQNAQVVIDRREKPINPRVITTAEVPAQSIMEGLLPFEQEALKHAISDEFLAAQRWTKDENGRIKTRSGATLFKPGYIDAIQKVLNHISKPH